MNTDNTELNTKSTIGFILIGLAVALYYYTNPQLIDTNTLTQVSGELAAPPYHWTDTESPGYIKLKLTGTQREYKLKGCAYYGYADEILGTKTGTPLSLWVDQAELTDDVQELLVYGVIIDQTALFSPDDFNDCREGSWKHVLFGVIFLPGVFIITFPFNKYFHKRKGGENSKH